MSEEQARKALDYFREKVKKAGFPDIYIQWNQGGGSVMTEEELAEFSKKVNQMGFDCVAQNSRGI